MPADPILRHCLELLSWAGALREKGLPVGEHEAARLAGLIWPPEEAAAEALADPYLAATMLWRTLGQGFRGNPNHLRPRDQDGPRLASDLLTLLKLHLRIRRGLKGLVAWPEEGQSMAGLDGDGGWCDLCGQCCCHCGTVPTPPQGVDYPPWFYHALAGEALLHQPFCPFLFQALERPLFFCALHPIKPLACRRFDQTDCRRGRPGRGFPGRAGEAGVALPFPPHL
ncbi:hypothetical protein AAU61_09095 [Desulfocarbo indianensis]|nr:hypothetical protein AAU61_09095 [Desulfocarbo indianensis]